MALAQCKECKKEVSTSAKTCPHCGVAKPVISPPPKAKELIVTGGFLLLFFTVCRIAVGPPQAQEQPAQVSPEEKCGDDLTCWADFFKFDAEVECAVAIPKLAKYSYEWTDGFGQSRLQRIKWKNKKERSITYSGDKIRFQNGFGVKVPMIYQCDFDTNTKQVIDVRAWEGRIR